MQVWQVMALPCGLTSGGSVSQTLLNRCPVMGAVSAGLRSVGFSLSTVDSEARCAARSTLSLSAWLSSLQCCRPYGQSFSKQLQSVQQMVSLDGFRETV